MKLAVPYNRGPSFSRTGRRVRCSSTFFNAAAESLRTTEGSRKLAIFQHARRPAKLFRPRGAQSLADRNSHLEVLRGNESMRRSIGEQSADMLAKTTPKSFEETAQQGKLDSSVSKQGAEIPPALKTGKESRSQTVPRAAGLGLIVPIGIDARNSWTEHREDSSKLPACHPSLSPLD